jgi:hypothetical protein
MGEYPYQKLDPLFSGLPVGVNPGCQIHPWMKLELHHSAAVRQPEFLQASVAVVGNEQGNRGDLAAGQAVHLLMRSAQLLCMHRVDFPFPSQKTIPRLLLPPP